MVYINFYTLQVVTVLYVLTKMAASGRAYRLLKAMELLKQKTTFDHGIVLSKLNLESVSNGTFKGSFIVDKSMCNMAGTLHGGHIASVIDVLSFYTQLSNTDGRLSWTTSMNVYYIGVVGTGEKVNVITKSLISGSTSIVETYFHNDTGKLVAKGTTSFLAAKDNNQVLIKDLLGFDVYEN